MIPIIDHYLMLNINVKVQKMNTLETRPLLRSARALHIFLCALTLLATGATLGFAAWVLLDLPRAGMVLAETVGFAEGGTRAWQGVALGALALVYLGLLTVLIYRGQQIFKSLLREDVLGASTAARQAARLLWILLVWGVAARMAGSVVATWHYPVGERSLSLSLGSTEVSTLFAALLASFIAHAFGLGAALWDDHKEVI